MQANFERLIQSLAQTLGAQLEVKEGETEVFFDFEDFPVLVEYRADVRQVLLSVTVAALPEKNRAALLLSLLQGQFLFQRTAGATLAVDENAFSVDLQIVKDIETLTTENFPVLMENFLRVAEDWHETIENFGEKVTETPAETSTVVPFDSSSLRV
jgi:heme oxygenase